MKIFINKRIPETGIEMLKETGLDVAHPERISEENLFFGFSAAEARNGMAGMTEGSIIAIERK